MSDPFETNITNILNARKKVAQQIVSSRAPEETVIDESSVTDRLPYEISKTVQYIKTNEYQKAKKSLKKQGDTV